jgi:hypothetical protein
MYASKLACRTCLETATANTGTLREEQQYFANLVATSARVKT